jgi:hypothetical protein
MDSHFERHCQRRSLIIFLSPLCEGFRLGLYCGRQREGLPGGLGQRQEHMPSRLVVDWPTFRAL